jgi:uncharacterized protein YndB with AHSA1/START domain
VTPPLKRWWVPKSTGMSLLSCEADVRVGGRYRLVFDLGAPKTMAFFGRYLEVTPYSRLAGRQSGTVMTLVGLAVGGLAFC